jgi:diguanylate cyclase (GGDEF)-like protein
MPDDTTGRRVGPIRTAPLQDSGALREALQAEISKRVSPSVLVISGPDVGLRVRLDRSIDVGRDPTASLALRDESVSWRHARVEDRGSGEWAVVDLGSTNGVLLNGDKCGEPLLKAGDRVILGKTILEFQVADAIQEGFAQQVERLLHHDELSGLLVKRRFDAQLETTVGAVRAGSLTSVSVVVMDLDGLKAINDMHGHEMGAFVIGRAGQVIGANLGEQGFATRFGGDEYAAALPGVAKAVAVEVAESIRRAVVSHVYEKDAIRVYPGMSCGVAAVPDDADDAESAFRAADLRCTARSAPGRTGSQSEGRPPRRFSCRLREEGQRGCAC